MIDLLLQLGALSAPVAHDIVKALRERRRRGGREVWRSKAYTLGSEFGGTVPPEWTRYKGARPELRGQPRNSILAVKGLEKLSPPFRARLLDLCEGLGIPVDSMAVIMGGESGFNPAALNPLPAAGLVQLTLGARLPGFDTKEAILGILKMSAEEQLERVVAPFYARMKRARGATPGELRMLNFLPGEAGKPEDHRVGVKDEKDAEGKPTFAAKVYLHNDGLDAEKKGYITIGDVYAVAAKSVNGARGRRIAVDGTILDPSAPEVPPQAAAKPPALPPTPAAAQAAPAPAAAQAPAPAPKKSPSPASIGTLKASDSVGGLLLKLAEAGRLEPVVWVPVKVGDLIVDVTADALSAHVAWTNEKGQSIEEVLRIPCSYADQVQIARQLGAISPTVEIWDATYRAAALKVLPQPQKAGPAMLTLGYTVIHNDNLKKYNATPGTLIRDVGKGWILHPRLNESGAVNYGWILPSGRAIQTPGAVHGPGHFDYSQTCCLVKRQARDASGNAVDLLEYIRKGGAIAKRWLDVYA